MRTRRRRFIIAFLASSIMALIIGIISNVAANTLKVDQPVLIWVALAIAFLISLPINLYLALRGVDQSSEKDAGEKKAKQNSLLPAKLYPRFFGREALLNEIINSVRDIDRRRIIGIDGMGGIGKTALVREVVERCLNDKLFDTIIWEPRASDTALSSVEPLNWTSLLVSIARQLGVSDIQRLTEFEKQKQLENLLSSQRILIVLDNLETASIEQNVLIEKLHPLLSKSKVIMTSRRRFKGEVYAISLKGLEEEDAMQLVRHEAGEKGISRVAEANSQDIRTIAQTTGGSPLALKLVVGQLQHLPLQVVLYAIKHIQVTEEGTEEDDYVRFYKGLFWKSWELLSETAQRVLVSMSVFAPGIGGTFEAVEGVSEIPDKTLVKTIEELWRLSFIEVDDSSLRKTRYYLHPLTQYFVTSDIVKPSQLQ